MSENYVIMTDVSTDVEEKFAKDNGIIFISMDYTIGDENRKCKSIESNEILKKFYDGQRNGDLTKTSQINPAMYRDFFEPVVKEGKSVLYISLSSGLSGTFQSAGIAANELMEEYEGIEIVPVDSLCATAGMGLMVEAAVKNKNEGMSVLENAAWLNDKKKKILHWFKVDDLMYLKRGGRISAASAIVGTTLSIKPILKIDDNGKLTNFDKKRGTRGALKALLSCYEKSVDLSMGKRVYITHGDCEDEVDILKKMILEVTPDVEIVSMMLSPIIGAHTGPGMIAVIHWGNNR